MTLELDDFSALMRCCLLWVLSFYCFPFLVNHLPVFTHPSLHPAEKIIQNRTMFSKRPQCVKEASYLLLQTFPVKAVFLQLASVFFPAWKQHALSGSRTGVDRDYKDEQPHN